jgi:hypothetical protein
VKRRIQDGVMFHSIDEGNASELLMYAEQGERVLFVALKRHSASLIQGVGLNARKAGERTRANCLVPMSEEAAGMLISYPQATISWYPAVLPDVPDSHPWYDHHFLLDEPQEITRDQVYFQAEAEQAKQVDAPPATARKGIKKQEAIDAFGALVQLNLAKALADGPKWLVDARLAKGTKGGKHESMWCPVLLAICLYENKHVPKSKLNQVFFTHDFLLPWREEWHEKSSDLV